MDRADRYRDLLLGGYPRCSTCVFWTAGTPADVGYCNRVLTGYPPFHLVTAGDARLMTVAHFWCAAYTEGKDDDRSAA